MNYNFERDTDREKEKEEVREHRFAENFDKKRCTKCGFKFHKDDLIEGICHQCIDEKLTK